MIPYLHDFINERLNLNNDTVISWFGWIYRAMLDYDQYYNESEHKITDYIGVLQDYMFGELGKQSIIGRMKLKKRLLKKFNDKENQLLYDFLEVIFQHAEEQEELAKEY